MAKRDEGKRYKEELLKLIPEDKRAAVAEALGEQVEDHLGEHVMMRSDYSKKLDEVRDAATKVNAYNDSLTNWYTQNQNALVEAARLKEAALTTPAPSASNEPSGDDYTTSDAVKKMTANMISRDEAGRILQDQLAKQANDIWGITSSVAKLSAMHMQNFNEVLDPEAVKDFALKNRVQLDAAYNAMFRERYDKKAEEAAAKKQEDLEKKIRAKVEDEFRASNPQMPYSVSNEASLSPILSAMKAKDQKTTEHGVNAALDEYYRMQRPQ